MDGGKKQKIPEYPKAIVIKNNWKMHNYVSKLVRIASNESIVA